MIVLTLLLTGCAEAVERTPGERTPGERTPGDRTAGEITAGELTPGALTPATATSKPEQQAHGSPSKPRRIRRGETSAVLIRRGSSRTAPAFPFRATELTPPLRHQLSRTSWHSGCPVGLGQLRYLRIGYWGFDKRAQLGEMVVNASVVPVLRRAFGALFAARFPIRRMRLVDRYGGSDYASIQADNTSAFNCRDATGSSRWSEHAYGRAIDVNPIENPYVYADGTTTHPSSDPYLDRSNVRPGMAVPGGTLVRAFTAIGWGWGGRWPRPTDYQHFSVNGR
jgi:hypothetical protein